LRKGGRTQPVTWTREGSQEEERLITAPALAATWAAECRKPLVPCALPSCEHSPGEIFCPVKKARDRRGAHRRGAHRRGAHRRRDFLSSKESPGQKRRTQERSTQKRSTQKRRTQKNRDHHRNSK